MKVLTFINALLLGLIIALGSAPVWLPYFRRLKFGQFIREEGPVAHFKKAGTPTFGGVIFCLAFVIAGAVVVGISAEYLVISAATIGFSAIGFADDYIKVVKKNNLGLLAWQKLLGQLSVAIALWLLFFHTMSSHFYGGLFSVTGVLWLVFFVFLALATTNAVNLTDGIDGLCASVTLIVTVLYAALAIRAGRLDLALLNLVMAGALIGYLVYNWHPAKVFMGDTGSLALGGYVLANAVLLGVEWYIPVFGIIYVLETLSVILQVSYFKATGGKRLFKITPIHHHFEMLGWSEVTIVKRAVAVTTLASLVVYAIARGA